MRRTLHLYCMAVIVKNMHMFTHNRYYSKSAVLLWHYVLVLAMGSPFEWAKCYLVQRVVFISESSKSRGSSSTEVHLYSRVIVLSILLSSGQECNAYGTERNL